MLIEIKVQKNYIFEVEINCEYLDDKVVYHAKLINSFLSFFNQYDDYTANSMDEAILKITKSINNALDQAKSL